MREKKIVLNVKQLEKAVKSRICDGEIVKGFCDNPVKKKKTKSMLLLCVICHHERLCVLNILLTLL